MTNSRKFRTAIVGCGRISVIHIAALKAISDVEIVALCDLDEKLARSRAAENGISNVFTDVETMMKQVRPDVVHLLTPPRSHLPLIQAIAKYRAHVYAEKPLASTESEARAILEIARQSEIQICTGHSLLFEPPFREACKRIKDGEIGRVISVRAEQGFTYEAAARSAVIPWSYTYDWGIFDNIMPHPLSLACHFLQNLGEPKVVGFNLNRVREAAVEEIRVLIPAEGAVGEVTLSLCNSPEVSRVEVVGTRGRVLVDIISRTVLFSRQTGLPGLVTRFTSNLRTAWTLTTSSLRVILGIGTGKIKRYMGIRALIAEYYRSLRESTPPPVPPEDALLNVRLLDQIRTACEEVAKVRTLAFPSDEISKPRVLVTGATGFVGGQLVKRLSADAVPVRATTRLLSRATSLPGVQWIQCDLGREEDLKLALEGVETVFHCAGLVGPPGTLEDYERANVKATLSLAQLAARAGVKNFIYVSSLSVYGTPPASDGYFDETAPYDSRANERGIYTQTKLEADRALLEFASRQNGHGTPRIIVLRPGTIYGPGAKLPIGRFTLPSSQARPIVTGSRRVAMPLTYIDNMIDALLAAERSHAPSGSVYNVVDSTNCDQGEVAQTLHTASRGHIKPLFLPYPIVWTLMLGVDLASLLLHRRLGTARFRLKRTLADMRFKCTAARNELGWQPRVSLEQGMTRAYEASREAVYH
jgi:nucleoside-diphosphate-sugar epimerase/predicted dehydrogenase